MTGVPLCYKNLDTQSLSRRLNFRTSRVLGTRHHFSGGRKHERKTPLGRHRHRWKYYIKETLNEIVCVLVSTGSWEGSVFGFEPWRYWGGGVYWNWSAVNPDMLICCSQADWSEALAGVPHVPVFGCFVRTAGRPVGGNCSDDGQEQYRRWLSCKYACLPGATEWMVWDFKPLKWKEIFSSSHKSTLVLHTASCTMGTVAISRG